MRTFGFRTHVLFAVAAAVGVIAALGRPWYAASPQAVEERTGMRGLLDGQAGGFKAGVERLISESGGTTGWDALGTWGTVIGVLAAFSAACALCCLVPAAHGVAREGVRYGAFACFAIIVWKLVDTPGDNLALELRFGSLVAAGAALAAFTSGTAIASTSLRRRGSVQAAYAPR